MTTHSVEIDNACCAVGIVDDMIVMRASGEKTVARIRMAEREARQLAAMLFAACGIVEAGGATDGDQS